ncbi:hypothetical protein CBR_g17867 [Chara braunii]|uniref:Cupin type-1 domain-containing protein n=1 Tax=Chara braunii TaxID=69332 RepID=A0A388KVS1_CHABU|nr:hypothetical protein CBR_g17867 [Chara braunii]|eukprot:GBG74154.1 hypothetical protein CBR_g17867 [Chara braunii]
MPPSSGPIGSHMRYGGGTAKHTRRLQLSSCVASLVVSVLLVMLFVVFRLIVGRAVEHPTNLLRNVTSTLQREEGRDGGGKDKETTATETTEALAQQHENRRKTDSSSSSFVRKMDANAIPKSGVGFLRGDFRGWMIEPLDAVVRSGLKGGATSCGEVNFGSVRPGCVRGNHKHDDKNETIVLWGAWTKIRLRGRESEEEKGRREQDEEVVVGPDEVAVLVAPEGVAHAVINIDDAASTYLVSSQSKLWSTNRGRQREMQWLRTNGREGGREGEEMERERVGEEEGQKRIIPDRSQSKPWSTNRGRQPEMQWV